MNGDKASVEKLVKELNDGSLPPAEKVEIVVAPTFLYLERVASSIRKEIKVSAQNCYFESKGAFTGEISAEQLKDIGINWVILGHSERRDIFKESNELVGKKVGHALDVGLSVIACVGEHIEEREAGKTEQVVFDQLKSIADHVKNWTNVVIAYEPVWAIGTGKNATPPMAQEVHQSIRNWLQSNVSSDVASATRILYGGSVKGSNCDDLAAMADVDGFLVGGASLIGPEFLKIISSVSKK